MRRVLRSWPALVTAASLLVTSPRATPGPSTGGIGGGCSSNGADATSGFLGGRMGVSNAPADSTAAHLGLFLEYQRDFQPRDASIRVSCGTGVSNENVQIGGNSVLLVFQVGVIQAL